jgi:hypothetical protein
VIILKDPISLDLIPLPPLNLLDLLKRQRKLQSSVFRAVGYGASFDDTVKAPHQIIQYWMRRVSACVSLNLSGTNLLACRAFSHRSPSQFTERLSFLSLDLRYFTLAMNPARDLDGTCFGDSGSGRFVFNEGNWVLVGLGSWGDIPCIATDKVYRLDKPSPQNFLYRVIQNLHANPDFYKCGA